MTGTDLTLIVTAHSETAVCGPTIRSADQAVAAARSAGYTVETVVAMDNPTDATMEYFRQGHFDHWERRVVHEGDPGLVRNALVPKTKGRYIAFLDADDLFSENWLAEGIAVLETAEGRGEKVIAHPEVNLIFDGAYALNHNVSQDSQLFTPYFLYVRNCYDTLCLSPRAAHLEVPYGARDIAHGLSREDWQFAIESMAGGWKHVVVPDTIIFKRRREFSMMAESSSRKSLVRSLPGMAINRVRDLATSDGDARPVQYPYSSKSQA